MEGGDEFRQRYSGRYFGKYRGIVSRTDDPRELGRIMTKVPVVMGFDDDIGWALPSPSSGGGGNSGDFSCPEIGDLVWVEFEEGDPSKAVWSPGPWAMREGENMLPKHSRGEADDTDYAGRGVGTAPPSQFEGGYGSVRFIQNRSGGSFLEFDDTSGVERLQLSHRTGTRIEMTSDGGLQEIAVAGVRRRVGGTHKVEVADGEDYSVTGISTFTAEASRTETFGAKLVQDYSGDIERTGQSKTDTWTGSITTQLGGGYSLQAGGQGSLTFGGGLAFMVRQNLQMTVLENMEICASNSLGSPTANSLLLHGYNGLAVMKSTDPTGLASSASLELDGIIGVSSATLAAGLSGTQVVLDGTPVSGSVKLEGGTGGGAIHVMATPAVNNVLLGGTGAAEPFIKGNSWFTFITSLLTALSTHTHPSAMGPTSFSADFVAQVAGLTSQATAAKSLSIMGK